MFVFNSKEELVAHAEEESKKVDSEYQHTVYLYYLARFFVLVYEAKIGKLPIQVWNEYRNAFDHFARFLTSNDKSHISKMEGHIQRAALDVMKLLSHQTQDQFIELYESYKPDVKSMVDNGRFPEEIDSRKRESENLFVDAKVSDGRLGSDIDDNKQVLNKYIDAAFSTISNLEYMSSKSNDLNNAQIKYNSIHTKGAKGAFWEHMWVHTLFYGILIVGGILIGAVGKSYFHTSDVKKSLTKEVQKLISTEEKSENK